MQEDMQGFGHPETFMSSHQSDNCPLTVNTFLTLSKVQEAAECVWMCGKARACLFNSADSDLLENLGEVVNNVSEQNTCANMSNKPQYEETADFCPGHLYLSF